MDTEIKHKYPLLRKYGWLTLAAVVVAAMVAWAVIAGSSSSYYADDSGLVIGDVEKLPFEDYIHINARVETGVVVHLSALETGIVEKKWVEEGAMVNAGDVILTLHNPTLRQQILDSESQLAEKQNMLRDTEIAMEKERLQIKQDILSARTLLNQKKRMAMQESSLYSEKLASREEYLKAKEDYELALANFNLLIDRQRQDSLYRSVQIAMMRESLHNMQENFALVRQRADNLYVRASHSGQLGSLNAELGQSITSGQQVGQINILDNYKMSAKIDEHYIDRVVTGLPAKIDHRGQKMDMMVSKVYPEVIDGLFRADLSIEGVVPENLRVGQTYPVDIILSEPTDAVIVPRGTFFQSTGGRWAYVVDSDGKHANRREIRIGRQNPKYYEVLEGLSPGERVIISSYSAYGDVDRVVIRASAP